MLDRRDVAQLESLFESIVRRQDICLHDLFAVQAGNKPAGVAVVCGHERLSYGELLRRSLRLSSVLREMGVGPEVRVAVCLERTVDLVVALLAVLAAGGAYVPLDPTYPKERLALLLGDAAAPVLLSRELLLDRLPDLRSRPGLRVLCLDRAPAFRSAGSLLGCSLAGTGVVPDNLAYVIYTSGSTGRPKGVAIRHRSAVALVAWAAEVFSPDELRGVLAATSVCFDLSVFEIFVPLSLGGTVHLAENALALGTLPSSSELTLVNTVPSALGQLLRSGGLPAGVSTVNLAGEALSGSLVEQIHARTAVRRVWNLYGPSEDTTYSTAALLPRRSALPPSIGHPIAGTRAHLLDSSGNLAADGEVGELYLAGVGLARGYLGRPDLTAERFLPDPWGGPGERLYRTGDLARRGPQGELQFLGRIDQQVKIRGFRIELGEIEATLERHPAVDRALVVAREETGEKRLVAYAVPVAGATVPGARELRAFLRRTLPEYMLPAAYVSLTAFPLLPNGKIDRGSLTALPAPAISAAGADEEFVAPRTALEEAVAGIWSEVLGQERIGAYAHFFERGGHSLSAMQVVSRVRDSLGVDLSVPALFEEPTVEGLARRIGRVAETSGGSPVPPLRPMPREGAVPLSFAQEGLWFLSQLAPESPFYNVPAALRISGKLDRSMLAWSFEEIVRRHEALRTTFDSASGTAIQVIAQVIAKASEISIPNADLSGLPPALREGEASRLALEEALHPFDLARGPLLRTLLLRVEETEHTLVLNLHHIVSDGWSIEVLLRELAAFYGAASTGVVSPFPPLPVQYADFSLWQRRWLTGEALAAELSYWRERLLGVPPLHDLLGDRPRPAAQSFRGAVHTFTLPAKLSRDLAALSGREGGTLFMGLLASFKSLLLRLTDHEDLVVGSAVANRNRSEIEGLIGFFANMLVLRTRMSGADGFGEALARVRETALGAYAHQELPFEKLVEELAPERDLSRNPLFQLAFVLQGVTQEREIAPGTRLSRQELDWKTSHFDLTFHAWDLPEGIVGRLAYSTDLFDGSTIARLAEQLERLVAGMVATPDRPLASFDLLSAAEREGVLVGWNLTATDYPRDESIPALFSETAMRFPDRVALVSGAESLSYGELDRRAERLARPLRALGVGPDVLVGLFVERSIAMLVSILGILKAGGAYLPLDVGYPEERLAFMLADARPAAVVTVGELAARLPRSEAPRLLLEHLKEDRASASATAAALPDPLHLAYVMYTSGSTGRPKGVATVHRGVVRLVRGSDFADFSADRVFLQMAPAAFDASTLEIWGPLLNGGRLAILPPGPISIEEIGFSVLAHGVDTLWLTAGLFHLMAQENLTGLGSLRQLLAGGDVLSPAHVEKALAELPGCVLINGYGPTEGTTFTCCHAMTQRSGGSRLGGPVPIGRPIANTKVYILDRLLEPAPVGAAGELYIGGDGLARGYLGQPERTAERFVPHPQAETSGERLYRTGDLARWRPDGSVEFLGRTDHQVKLRGFRIELGEIESVLAAAPGVKEAVVLAREDVPGERRLVAYFTTEGSAAPETVALRSFLAERLPEYMVPAAFVALPSLPLSPNGKVDRRALPEPEMETARETSHESPRTPIEEIVASLWAGALGHERIGVHDNFFDRGGHSLSAARVVSQVRDALGVALSVRVLFEQPTVAGFSRRIGETMSATGRTGMADAPPLRRISRDGASPLSFAQEGLWFLSQLAPESPFYNIPAALRISGRLDSWRLGRCLSEIVRRQEILRTTFENASGTARQVIAPASEVWLPNVDLRGLPAERRELEASRLALKEALRPFDLARGPLLRVLLLRSEEAAHTLVLNLHHIVADGWSIEVLLEELAALYGASSAGFASPLPELAVQYADFSLWQRSWLTGDVLAAELSYWRERLLGAPPLHDLLGDRPRPAAQSFRGAVHTFSLPAGLSRDLAAFSRREGSTLFMGLLASFKALLLRLTDHEDLVVGSAVANRNRSEIEGLIGFFANMLVLRTRMSGTDGYRAALGKVRETALGAYAHQELPFEKLVEELAPERDLSRNPLFQLAFVLQGVTEEREIAPGLRLSRQELDWKTSHFDLTFHAWNLPEGIVGRLAYSTDLFDGSTIARLAEQWERLVAGMVAAPDRPLTSLELLSAAERERVLLGWNLTATEYPREESIPALFSETAARFPDRVALVSGAESLSYGELDRRAERLACPLLELGVGPDVLVGLFVERSISQVVSILGILKAGGAYLPLDVDYPEERLAFMLADARPAAVLTAGSLEARLPRSEAPRLLLEDLGKEQPSAPQAAKIRPDPLHLAYVMYTSGSTGRPKGVATVHRGVVRLVRGSGFADLSADRVFLQMAPAAFDASTLEIWGPLLNGGRLAIPPPGPVSLEELGATLLAQEVDTLWLTAGLFHLMVQENLAGLGSLRQVLAGGDVLSPSHVERALAELPGCVLINGYGPTEGTTFTCCHEMRGGARLGGPVPIGRPIANTRVYLLDRLLEPVPVGAAGELYIGGDGLARGYLGQPERTAERFVPHPQAETPGERLYRTGDLARWRSDGSVEFLGRTDHQVKLRGFRIELGEIESVLAAAPGVKEAVIVAQPVRGGDPGERRLVAYLTTEAPEGPAAFETASLRAFLADRLPEYMVPAVFVVLPSLPLSPNGKVDRRALPEPPKEREGDGAEFVAPRTPVEETLAFLWSELLDLPRIGVHDDFFLLGGHSLMVTRVASRLREAFGLELALRQIFEARTVAQLAEAVERQQIENAEALELERLLAELEGLSEEEAERIHSL